MKTSYILKNRATILVFVSIVAIQNTSAQNPIANFSANVTSGCAPLTVYFTDQSTGNPTLWNWQFGNGQLSTIKNPVVTFSQPGTYTVKLVVRNANGIDEEEKINYITVSAAPSAGFSANLTTACAPATIQFTDQSTAPPGINILTWEWNFGDGGTSTLQNPSHTYTALGFYTVSLKITSSTGCNSTAVIGNYIRIVSGITTNFTYLAPSTCTAPFVVSFQAQSSGPGTLSYTWNLGNGNTSNLANPTTTYSATGNYTVQLDVQSNLGCSGSIQKVINVTGVGTDFTSPPSACIGQIVNFQNNSSSNPVASTWDFGDGTTSGQINPTKAFLAMGTYLVKLINQYSGCTDSVTKSILITDKPFVDFTANDTTSCRAPFTVQFNDLTSGATGWSWDFGDGTTSTQQNPSHLYSSLGDYTVTLTATTGAGCTNTIVKTNYIKIRKTQITIINAPEGGCVPFTYNPLTNIQTVDNIVSYAWNLGEPGALYNVQFPTHTYNNTGNYDISLTVTTQSGCTETLTIPNGVKTGTSPVVNFSYSPNTPICASTSINFTDLSTTSPGAQVEWLWNFDDGDFSALQNPAHVFKDTGLIKVTLVVSNNGCLDSSSQTLHILPPVANFGYTLNCNNRLQVTFSDSSLTNPVYGPITYEWRMGDPANTIFNGAPPTFTYPSFGNYNVTLIVTNGTCSYQVIKPVKITDDKADFSLSKNPVCKNELFTLTAINSDSATIANYTWTIGANPPLIDTSRSIVYSLTSYGAHDVTLTLVDIYGCTISNTNPGFITVSGPVPNFVPTTPGGCINKPVTFTDLTTPAGNIVKWSWDFGDGSQQVYTAPPFSHIYSQAGSYNVTLTVTDAVGCSDTYSNSPFNLLVTDSHAGFKADTFFCPGAPLQLTDTSSGPGLTYLWNFGDGSTSTLQNPQHAFPMGDNDYSIKLNITDIAGCKDSISKTNYIKIRSPKAAFALGDTASICPPLVSRFTFQGQDYSSFNWDFGDGSTSTLQDPIYFYNQYGTFTPKLYVIGNGGCIDSAQAIVNVYDLNTDAQILFSPTSGCNSLMVNFNLTTPPGFKYTFYYGDGTFDTTQQKTLNHFFPSPGNYYPYMIMYDTTGCQVGKWGPGPVNVFGAIPLFGIDKKEFCDQGQVLFSNYTLTNDPIISSVWDFGDGSTSTAVDPLHSFTSPGTYIVKLNVVTENQCASSFIDTIRVYRTPDISITSRDTLCLNTAEPFRGILTQPDTALIWQWNFGNGSASQQQNANVTYTATGNYQVQLAASNKLGCGDTTSKSVYVAPAPTVSAVTDPIIIPSGTGTFLNMDYTGNIISYSWTPLINLDCSNCPAPFATPRTTTKYTVQIQDIYGCTTKDDVTVRVVCDENNYFIPNTFSPNGDGSNDIFYPRGKGLFRIKSFRVFNRWGELVFEKKEFQANDPLSGWNGTYKGKNPVQGVYIYQAEVYCNNDELVQLSGNVTLIQ